MFRHWIYVWTCYGKGKRYGIIMYYYRGNSQFHEIEFEGYEASDKASPAVQCVKSIWKVFWFAHGPLLTQRLTVLFDLICCEWPWSLSLLASFTFHFYQFLSIISIDHKASILI